MNALTAQLEKLVGNAKRIRSSEFTELVEEYQELFKRYNLRLRPSVGSISLVSHASWTPQIGFSNMTTAAALRNKLAALKERRAKLEAPGRPTPEKAVQSWLISQGMQNAGHVKSIEDALGGHDSYLFVSDEIALDASGGTDPDTKVVADLLLVRTDAQEQSEIVNVELKSERTTQTHAQIRKFWEFMNADETALWREFIETMLDGRKRNWKEPGQNRGIVVWPAVSKDSAANGRTSRLMHEYKAVGIETICYFGPEYIFAPEPAAP